MLSILFSEDFSKIVEKYELCFQFIEQLIQNEENIFVATHLFVKLSEEIKMQHMK